MRWVVEIDQWKYGGQGTQLVFRGGGLRGRVRQQVVGQYCSPNPFGLQYASQAPLMLWFAPRTGIIGWVRMCCEIWLLQISNFSSSKKYAPDFIICHFLCKIVKKQKITFFISGFYQISVYRKLNGLLLYDIGVQEGYGENNFPPRFVGSIWIFTETSSHYSYLPVRRMQRINQL